MDDPLSSNGNVVKMFNANCTGRDTNMVENLGMFENHHWFVEVLIAKLHAKIDGTPRSNQLILITILRFMPIGTKWKSRDSLN